MRGLHRQSLGNGCSTKFNDTILDSHTYAYDALSRPTSRTSSGATTGTTGVPPVASSFAYNDRSEIVSATIGTNHFAHAYDCIGNQTNHVANAATNSYAHNALNQMVGRVPGFTSRDWKGELGTIGVNLSGACLQCDWQTFYHRGTFYGK